MQAYFLTRGQIWDVENFIDFLKTRTLMCPFKTKEGKDMLMPISMIVRPIQLWEIAFPKEQADIVFNSLDFDKYDPRIDSLKYKSMQWALRKSLGSKPIPKYKKDKTLFMPLKAMENIQIIPIGLRDDEAEFREDNGSVHEAI